MPGYLERHARSKDDWGTPGARSQERAEAASDDPTRARTPGRKNPDACKAAHWKGPHQPGLRMRDYGLPGWRGCRWDLSSWSGTEPRWFCGHEEYCAGCGKVLRTQLKPGECPDFRPMTDADHARVAASLERHREIDAARAARRPVVTGPQGYRKRKSA